MLTNRKGESVLDRAAVESDLPDIDDGGHPSHTTDNFDRRVKDGDNQMSKRRRVSGKVKDILHINNNHNDKSDTSDNSQFATLAPPPDTNRGIDHLKDGPAEMPGLHGFNDLLHHPVDTVKAKTERKTNKEIAANLLSPEVTHTQDVALIKAQDTLYAAETEEERQKASEDLEKLKKGRQDLFVRWTMDRHVHKIRRLDDPQTEDRKNGKPERREDFWAQRSMGWRDYLHQVVLSQAEKYGGQYIGSFAEPPPATQETVTACVERLLVATTPWQEFGMHIRRIYRWEDPKETGAYFLAFVFLWAIGGLFAAGCLALIGQVLRRRFEKPSVEHLRQDVKRTEDPLTTALTLREQIEKRGAQSWMEPLLEDMGEWLLLQLGDSANFFEVLLNFYEWRQPVRTAYTLVWLGIGCVAFYMTPIWLLTKMTTLFAGLTFFALFPLASRYPRYRLLVSPLKWLFWDIPNHAEWAIARLQIEGRRQSSTQKDQINVLPESKDRSTTLTSEPGPAISVHGSYTCTSNKHGGRLVVTSEDVRFEPLVGLHDNWSLPYKRMGRIEKVCDRNIQAVTMVLSQILTSFPPKINQIVQVGSGKDLLFIGIDDVSHTANNVASRDEVFTQVVGYSKLSWQVLG